MIDHGYGQWEYRVAVAQAERGELETVDGAPGGLCFAADTPVSMSIIQALDLWGATGWELVGMAVLSRDRLQYVLKRHRREDGWEGARIHMHAHKG